MFAVIPALSRASWATLPVTPRAEVDEHQVVVGAAGDDPQPQPARRRQALALSTILRHNREVRPGRFGETDRFGGDDVHQGPPCIQGKTALSILGGRFPAEDDPPRGPRSVLWVVKVTTSAWGTGLRVGPAGDQAGDVGGVDHNSAPTSSAISRKRAKSMKRE